MSKKIILAAVFALLIQVAGAQHSMVFTQRDNLFHEGKELSTSESGLHRTAISRNF